MILSLGSILLLLVFVAGCGHNSYFSPEERSDASLNPHPKINVFIMPKTPVSLCRKRVLMIPVFMAGKQEGVWGPSVTALIRSILLQESLFHTLALAPSNNIERHDMLARARAQGFDYVLEVVLPSILEPAGDSSGWVGLNLFLRDARKGYTIWHVYGEAQLLPQPTHHGFFWKDDFVPAPTVGQGIVAITRQIARLMRVPCSDARLPANGL